MSARLRTLATLLLLIGVVWPAYVRAQRTPPEYAIKGAFVFNVLKFVEWPATVSGPAIRLAVVTPHPLPDFQAAFAGKSIGGRPVLVQLYDDGGRLGDCDAVFVTADAERDLRSVLAAVAKKPVLTIAEQTGDHSSAAMLSVAVAQSKLAFYINLDAADAAGLQLNTNLLKLARSVESHRVRPGPLPAPHQWDLTTTP